MRFRIPLLAAVVFLLSVSPLSVQAQTVFTEDQYIRPRQPGFGEQFGQDVACDGNQLLVGSTEAAGITEGAGAVYSFRLDGRHWVEEQLLVASDGVDDDQFGRHLAMDGSVAVIGAEFADPLGEFRGAAYVFRHDGDSWVEEQKLAPDDLAPADTFGEGVAVHGDVAVVGSPGFDASTYNVGAIYVFEYNGVEWLQRQKLVPDDVQAGYQFGEAVAFDGTTIIVGAPMGQNPGRGTAYVFRHDGEEWIQTQRLLPTAPGIDSIGCSVAVAGDFAVVSASGTDRGQCTNTGAVSVFQCAGESYSQIQVLAPAELDCGSFFGRRVALDEDWLIAGAPLDDECLGVVYAFRLDGGLFQLERVLHRDRRTGVDVSFGENLAICGNKVLVGASSDDLLIAKGGGATYYDLSATLSLDAEPNLVLVDSTLAITGGGGDPENISLLAAVDVNGTEVWIPVLAPRFDADGLWREIATVPPSLGGYRATLRAYGIRDGRLAWSNLETVAFPSE